MEGKTVLVVEDELSIASLIKDIVSLYGAQVHHAAQGAEALSLIAEHSIDLAVIDITLPDINGIDLYHQLIEKRPEMASQVIFMSGYQADDRMQSLLDQTGSRFIHKPFHLNEFRKTLEELLV